MEFKVLVGILLLLTLTPVTAANVEINKNFNRIDKKIEISVKVEAENKNITVVDFLPFCFGADDISHGGVLKRTKEGVSFIEWNIQISKTIVLSYSPKQIEECPKELNLPPSRVMLEGEVFFSNELLLKEEDLVNIKKEICVVNGICEYPSENYFNCPEDCRSGSQDGVCDKIKDGRCDPDCVRLNMEIEDLDCLKMEKVEKPVFLYMIFIFLIIAIVIFFIYKIKVVR